MGMQYLQIKPKIDIIIVLVYFQFRNSSENDVNKKMSLHV